MQTTGRFANSKPWAKSAYCLFVYMRLSGDPPAPSPTRGSGPYLQSSVFADARYLPSAGNVRTRETPTKCKGWKFFGSWLEQTKDKNHLRKSEHGLTDYGKQILFVFFLYYCLQWYNAWDLLLKTTAKQNKMEKQKLWEEIFETKLAWCW